MKFEDARGSYSDFSMSEVQLTRYEERLEKLYFFFQGITALLPWSCILCTLDFYNAEFPNDDASFTFPVAFFVGSVGFNFIMVYIKRALSLNARVIGGLTILLMFLIVLPIAAQNLSDTKQGLWICFVLLFILGAANSVSNATIAGLAGHFPAFCRSVHSTGAGVAALITNVIRAIIVATSDTENPATDQTDILIFYGIAVFLLVLGVILHIVFIRSSPTIVKIEKHAELVETTEDQITHNLKQQWKVFKLTASLITAMFVSNIQTFMLYPGVLFQKPLDFATFTWTVIIIGSIFNAMDTSGKYISYMKFFIQKKVILSLVGIRFLFYMFFLWPVIDVNVPLLSESWFFLAMVAVFGFMNGAVISAVFVMAPDSVRGEKKEVAGFLAFNAMMTGIMIGTFLALPFSSLS